MRSPPADASAVGFPRFVRRLHCYYDEARLLVSVHHRLRLLTFPMRTIPLMHHLTVRRERPPRFRYDPFTRDVAFDPGRAEARPNSLAKTMHRNLNTQDTREIATATVMDAPADTDHIASC